MNVLKAFSLASKTVKNVVFTAIGAVFLVVVLFLVFNKPGGTEITCKSMLKSIEEKSDMSTIEYSYNSIATVYDEKNENVKYHVLYKGTVQAGIDFKKIEIEKNKAEKKIEVTLPEIKITSISVSKKPEDLDYISNKSIKTETFLKEAYTVAEKDLSMKIQGNNALFKAAEINAKNKVEALLKPWVDQMPEYKLEVKTRGDLQ